jgi:hypothetical protein
MGVQYNDQTQCLQFREGDRERELCRADVRFVSGNALPPLQ